MGFRERSRANGEVQTTILPAGVQGGGRPAGARLGREATDPEDSTKPWGFSGDAAQVGQPGRDRCRQPRRAHHRRTRRIEETSPGSEGPARREGDPKKSGRLLRPGRELPNARVIYGFVEAEKVNHGIGTLCRVDRKSVV